MLRRSDDRCDMDPLRLYAFALREGDTRLAELLHRRFLRCALRARVLRTLRARLTLGT